MIIVHAGTNDITNKINYLRNVKQMVKEVREESPNTQIVFSSVIQRFDIKDGPNLVTDVNVRLKNYCQQNNLSFINYDNITENFFGKKKLHPNNKGTSLFARNFLSFLK